MLGNLVIGNLLNFIFKTTQLIVEWGSYLASQLKTTQLFVEWSASDSPLSKELHGSTLVLMLLMQLFIYFNQIVRWQVATQYKQLVNIKF